MCGGRSGESVEASSSMLTSRSSTRSGRSVCGSIVRVVCAVQRFWCSNVVAVVFFSRTCRSREHGGLLSEVVVRKRGEFFLLNAQLRSIKKLRTEVLPSAARAQASPSS